MKAIKLIVINIIVIILFSILTECILVGLGQRPYSSQEKNEIILKSGKQFFQQDDILGYKHCSGKFDIELKKGLYNFSATHKNTLRITSDLNALEYVNKDEIWIFGCSFTYGWSLNDEATFSWDLQKRLKQYKVVNWGVSGYGTLQFYLQLKAALKSNKKPTIVIVNHGDFHHERNINSYNYKRSISKWNNFEKIKRPYLVSCSRDTPKIKYVRNEYCPWNLSTKYAMMKNIQFGCERILDGIKHKKSLRITASLLDSINDLCKENNIELIITNVGLKKEFIRKYSAENDIAYLDISVDYTNPEFNNLPYDNHPNVKANQVYSDKIYKYISSRF